MGAEKQKRWNATTDGKVLASLFETGLADPRAVKAADIDPVEEKREEFAEFSAQQFRNNCKTMATNWMAGKAVEGIRLQSLNLANPESEEKEVEEAIPENTETMTPPKAPAVATAKPVTAAKKKHKANETEFSPRFTSHIHPAENHWREQIVIETPSSFDGAKGSCEAAIEDNTQFVFKTPPNDIFNDPHTIHAHQASKFGRTFGDDSAKAQAFRDSTKSKRKNWCTFRHDLKHKSTKSPDLGGVPWIDFAQIDCDGRLFSILIVETKSIEPIEAEAEIDDDLKISKFASPTKITGVDFANGTAAQEAPFLQEMLKRGFKMSDLQNFAERGTDEMNEGNMNVDGDTINPPDSKSTKIT